MGEAADDIIDQIIDGYAEYDGPYRRSKRRGYQYGAGNYNWRQADGTVIDMRKMDDVHLANAINFCRRENLSPAKLKQLMEVQNKRIAQRNSGELTFEDFQKRTGDIQ